MSARAWRSLAKVALPVVMCSQRESGLWSLPTSDVDRTRLYARAGTKEARFRLSDPFGSDSITVTWRALHALRQAFGTIPPEVITSALRGVEDLRSRSGAYGRRREGWKADQAVNESARHTAMGMLVQLSFGDLVSPVARLHDSLPTVKWLLDAQLPDGGWAYQQAHLENGAEPLSTAYVLYALSLFADRAGDSAIQEFGLEEALVRALGSGFSKLVLMRGDTIWRFEHDQRDTEIADATDVAWMLLQTSDSRFAARALTNGKPIAVDAASWIVKQCLAKGMPAQLGGRISSASASIHTLLLSRYLPPDQCSPEVLRNIALLEGAVLAFAGQRDFWRRMGAWNWAVLAELCARQSGITNTFDASLVEASLKVRQAGFSGGLLKQDVSSWRSPIPTASGPPILYALSRGRPDQVPSTRLEAAYSSLPTWSRWMIPQVPGAAVGYYVSEILRSF